MNLKKRYLLVGMLLIMIWGGGALSAAADGLIVDHQAATRFAQIPADSFASIRASFNIYYGHTSHGSQIVSGLSILAGENPALYRRPAIHETGPDLGSASWDQRTRDYLNAHPGVNLVIWSWCGQLSSYDSSQVNDYLQKMHQLETGYPKVIFVYMTGHLDGRGPSGRLYQNNRRIREFCKFHGKVLFDFADIESVDPAGTYYPDGSDQCEWCAAWCATHDCPLCSGCAHSHCFNCYRKGRAFWWMLAHLNGTPTSGDDSDGGGGGSCFIRTLRN